MEKISCNILFYGKPYLEVFSIEPFDKVEIRSYNNEKFSPENVLLDRYNAIVNGVLRKITLDEPYLYVANLHQGMIGSYSPATYPKVTII